MKQYIVSLELLHNNVRRREEHFYFRFLFGQLGGETERMKNSAERIFWTREEVKDRVREKDL